MICTDNTGESDVKEMCGIIIRVIIKKDPVH